MQTIFLVNFYVCVVVLLVLLVLLSHVSLK